VRKTHEGGKHEDRNEQFEYMRLAAKTEAEAGWTLQGSLGKRPELPQIA
jgi:hypothetical protein